MAYFDQVPPGDVPKLYVPNSVPILYRFERSSRKLIATKLQSAAGGSHARWLLSPENHVSIREAIQPGGMLTRAVLDSWDRNGDGLLSASEIEAGVNAMLSDDVQRPPSCAVIAVAKKIVRELPADDATVTVEMLELLAAEEVAEIAGSVERLNPADLISDQQQLAET